MCRVQFSPTDNRVVASTSFGHSTLTLWDVDTGEMISSISEGGWCSFTVFSPDGRTLAAIIGGYDAADYRDVQLSNTTSEWFRSLSGHQGYVSTASFSVDGSKLASGSEDGTCKVWDSSTGELIRSIYVRSPVHTVCWGRDWVMDVQRAMAFATGHHPRLGAGSQVQGLDVELVRTILDYAQGHH